MCDRCKHIKPHKLKKQQYKKASDSCCKGCANGPTEENGKCLVRASCDCHRGYCSSDQWPCSNPCRACSYWEEEPI